MSRAHSHRPSAPPDYALPAYGGGSAPVPLRHYVRALRRQVWLIAAIVAVAVGAAVVVSATQASVHRASMKIVVGQGNGFFQPQFGATVQPFTQTMTNLLESDIVAAKVIRHLNLNTTPKALLGDLNVSTNPESSVLQVTYDSTHPRTAVLVLRQIASTFGQLVREKLNTPRAKGTTVTPLTASVFDPPHLNPGTVAPHPVRNALLAGLLGLLVGIGVVLLRESLRERVYDRDDAESWARAPVIGTIPKMPARARPGPPQLWTRRDHVAFEALQMLRATLEFSELGEPGSVIVVTSALPNEGKTTIAASLATSLAGSGRDVIAVDGDLRQPTLGAHLGRPLAAGGLADVIAGRTDVLDALEEVPLLLPPPPAGGAEADGHGGHQRLRALLQAPVGGGRPEALRADGLATVLRALRQLTDYVIVDTPPILAAADAYPLVRAADTVLLTVREGHTSRDAIESAASTLDALGVTNLAVVLNEARLRGIYGQYAGYGERAGTTSAVG